LVYTTQITTSLFTQFPRCQPRLDGEQGTASAILRSDDDRQPIDELAITVQAKSVRCRRHAEAYRKGFIMGRRGRTGEDNPFKDDSRQTRAALMGSLNGKHVPTDNPGKQKMASSLVSLGPTAKFCIGRDVHFYRAPAAGRFEQSPRSLLGSRQAVVLTMHRATSTGPIGCIPVLAHHAASLCFSATRKQRLDVTECFGMRQHRGSCASSRERRAGAGWISLHLLPHQQRRRG